MLLFVEGWQWTLKFKCQKCNERLDHLIIIWHWKKNLMSEVSLAPFLHFLAAFFILPVFWTWDLWQSGGIEIVEVDLTCCLWFEVEVDSDLRAGAKPQGRSHSLSSLSIWVFIIFNLFFGIILISICLRSTRSINTPRMKPPWEPRENCHEAKCQGFFDRQTCTSILGTSTARSHAPLLWRSSSSRFEGGRPLGRCQFSLPSHRPYLLLEQKEYF